MKISSSFMLILICLVAVPAQAWTINSDLSVREDSYSSDQMLINGSSHVGSGIYSLRRVKKSWPSARIAPRKPRKKLNPDSMAGNF